MIGYVTLGTNDLAKAAAFYDAIAAELGVPRMMEFDNFIAWGKEGGRRGHRPDQAVRRQRRDRRQWRDGGAGGQRHRSGPAPL